MTSKTGFPLHVDAKRKCTLNIPMIQPLYYVSYAANQWKLEKPPSGSAIYATYEYTDLIYFDNNTLYAASSTIYSVASLSFAKLFNLFVISLFILKLMASPSKLCIAGLG